MDELKTLLGRYSNIDELAMNGVTVGGQRYMFLSATDRVVRAKKGTSGVHCIKTVQGMFNESFYRPLLYSSNESSMIKFKFNCNFRKLSTCIIS